MKTIILCGGKGTRLHEETEYKSKPMVNIGDVSSYYEYLCSLIHDADEMLRQELAEVDFDWSHDLRG